MSDQSERTGVSDVYQLAEDVVIPRGTMVAIRLLENELWVLRADLLRKGDTEPRLTLPEPLLTQLKIWARARSDKAVA